MKLWIRRLMLALFGAAVVAVLVYVFMPQPVPVDTAAVERGLMQVTVDEEGKTRVRQRYVVSAPLAGVLRRLDLKEGDALVAGQTIIARIDPTDPSLLDARAQAMAEARVRGAQAAVEQADANYDHAATALEFAQREHQRLREASESGAATSHELDNVDNIERLVAQQLRSAQSGRQIARFELEQARSALLMAAPNPSTAGAAPTPVEVPSPITGRVLRLLQESQAVVQPGTPLVEVGDPTDLEIVIDVLSTDAVQIVPGAKVMIERWGGPGELVGVVRLVEPAGFTKISALGVEEQRVNVIVNLEEPAEAIRSLGDGYRVEGRIVIWEKPEPLKAPASALFRLQNDWAVFVLEHDRAVQRRVLIGRQNGLEAEVLDGLSPGQRVIVHPSDRIQDGVKVRAR